MLKQDHSTTINKAVLEKNMCQQTGISQSHPWFPIPHPASCCSCQVSKVWKLARNDVTNCIPSFHRYHWYQHTGSQVSPGKFVQCKKDECKLLLKKDTIEPHPNLSLSQNQQGTPKCLWDACIMFIRNNTPLLLQNKIWWVNPLESRSKNKHCFWFIRQ